MTELFTWSPRISSSGDTQANLLSSQFGDGYSQRLSVGINNLAAVWSVSFTGTEAYLKPIQAFFIRHKGARHFLWTPPLAEQGRFITSGGWQLQPHGKQRFTLSTTFQQVFVPEDAP
ncbi:phage tail protein [Pseudomonas sp. 21LCFQ010]|uniref:phage tail protein n=1 Tax=Pseudomonas sp. 21LCFQ010 TaxID=2957506 RepID=UPI00209718D7|nr:phage tail protein [Pseudomonas sp. 21LCFQ010]MCO8164848.1 phage tail protein [Pseudomonas sp. 21LCFQ010]